MKQLNTRRGILTVVPACSAQELESFGIDEGLGFFWHNRPDLQHQTLVRIVKNGQGRVSLIYNPDRVIVGYVTITVPDEDTRWGRDHLPGLYELGGIEIGRAWRGYGLSHALMEAAFSDGEYDKGIVIATGYRWCWDYESSGLSTREYRDMLHRVMQRFGFEFFDTDEPNVAWYPDNALVGRIGKDAPPELAQKFKALLFENPASSYTLSEFVGR